MASETLDQLAHELATSLGEGWAAEPSRHRNDGWLLRHGDQAELHLYPLPPGRLSITGTYHRVDGYEHDHSQGLGNQKITVSAARSAASIARDIQRRLLPGYRHNLTVVRERAAGQQRREAKLQAVQARISALASVDYVGEHDRAVHLRSRRYSAYLAALQAIDADAHARVTGDPVLSVLAGMHADPAGLPYLVHLALRMPLCPMHLRDYATCFDHEDPECARVRARHPGHDTR
jgi:hypothetical protein